MTPSNLLKSLPVARTKKILDAARDYPCAHCNARDGTIVPAHCNELALGRGFAHKTPDYLVAYLCHRCHDAVDGRAQGLKREEKHAMWCRAYVVTISWLFRDGVIEVA